MDDRFNIYVEQLRDGQVEKLEESYSPEFLDIHEKDLIFKDPVLVNGEAYLADDMLVLHIDVRTYGIIPCRICNEPVRTEITVQGVYHAVAIKEIKTGIFNLVELLRETLLIEVPALAECNQGKCPQRTAMKHFIKEEGASDKDHIEEGYHPFADLKLDFDNKKLK